MSQSTVTPEVAERAARLLIADAAHVLTEVGDDRDLLAMLRNPPEALQIILPALRAAEALLDGRGEDAALQVLSEFPPLTTLSHFQRAGKSQSLYLRG